MTKAYPVTVFGGVMARKTRRKFYKPHTPEAKARISAGVRAYQEKVRAALANSEASRD